MKIIMNVKLKEGYEKWKNLFLSVDTHREKYGIKVFAMDIQKMMKLKFIKF